MKLGMFMMPLHDPTRNLTEVLTEDRDAIILADKLEMVEAWCGEHVSSTAEPIASSLMFFASTIEQTRNIKFASIKKFDGFVLFTTRIPICLGSTSLSIIICTRIRRYYSLCIYPRRITNLLINIDRTSITSISNTFFLN